MQGAVCTVFESVHCARTHSDLTRLPAPDQFLYTRARGTHARRTHGAPHAGSASPSEDRVVVWMRAEDAGKLPPVAGTWEVLKNVASAI